MDTFSGSQVTKELDSCKDIVPVINTEVVASVFGFCLHKPYKRDGEGANGFLWAVD